jgi:hypothetical protein
MHACGTHVQGYPPAPPCAAPAFSQVASARPRDVPRGSGETLTSSSQASCAALRLVCASGLAACRQIASSLRLVLDRRWGKARIPRRHEATAAAPLGGLGGAPVDVEGVGDVAGEAAGADRARFVGVDAVEGAVDVVGLVGGGEAGGLGEAGVVGADEVELVGDVVVELAVVAWVERAAVLSPR